jgi:alkanesulfonate monooxygenase SsuD/methylene tetrahydromethanopterin reductase-like flavin-dependent oxidoreductase (luciferase family)
VKVGIGLPTSINGVRGEQLTEWARRAEAAGFDSLATMDGLAFPNYEPLVALGAAAAVTKRIELITAITIVPYRQNAALVAKQAATLHALSGGRLSLGIAIGGSTVDYAASGVPWEERGRRFDGMVVEMRRAWAGEARDGAAPVGPDVSAAPPSILIGGAADIAFDRAARHGEGWIAAGGPPAAFGGGREMLDAAFRRAARAVRPRALASGFFSLGADAENQARRGLRQSFSAEPGLAELIIADTHTAEAPLRDTLSEFERRGCDDFLLFPASADPEQVDLLARAIG